VLPFGLLLQRAKENTLPVVDIYYYLVKLFGGKRQVLGDNYKQCQKKRVKGAAQRSSNSATFLFGS